MECTTCSLVKTNTECGQELSCVVCVCVCVSLLQSHAKPGRPQTPLSELCDLQTPTTSGAGLQTHQTQGKADRQTDRQTICILPCS